MIRPILATENPYEAAQKFQSCGWHIDFQTPPGSKDPLAGVSIYGNELLLGTMEEKYVDKNARPYIGAGVEIHILIPHQFIHEVYRNHLHLNPSELKKQSWSETGFKFTLLGYRFMFLAQQE